MTKKEKDLITALVMHSINKSDPNPTDQKTLTEEKFFKLYPVDLENNKNYLLGVFEKAYKSHDEETLDYALMLQGYIEIPVKTYAPIFRKLLKVKWHDLHERILDLLISMKDINNIDVIYETGTNDLENEGGETIVVKAIWGLGEIGTPKALEKVRLLTKATSSEYVRDEASKVLRLFSKSMLDCNP